MRYSLIGLLLILCLGSVLADEQLLLTATNDLDTGVDKLWLRLDTQGEPTHLLHRQEGKSEKTYTPSALEKGVVLRRQSGKDLLVLRTESFEASKGATIVITYLYNGIPPAAHRSMKLQLRRVKDKWRVFKDGSDESVGSMRFLANLASVFGFQQAVGIREIQLKP